MPHVSAAMIRTLRQITTRTESGQHFTAAFPDWQALEDAGLIAVERPIHDQTGIPYSQEYWTVEVTNAGAAVLDATRPT
jgi:hypothetical protein